MVKREVDANTKLPDVAARFRNLSQSERDALAPNYKQELEEYKKSFDVIRQMANLKIRQGKVKAAPEVEKESSE